MVAALLKHLVRRGMVIVTIMMNARVTWFVEKTIAKKQDSILNKILIAVEIQVFTHFLSQWRVYVILLII